MNWWLVLGVLPGVLIGLTNWKLLNKTFFQNNNGLGRSRPGILIPGRLILLFASFAIVAWIYIDALPFMAGGYIIVLIFQIVEAFRKLR